MKNGLIVKSNGTHYWYRDDFFHREDGPAIFHANGSQSWWLNGFRHRVDGPAIIFPNGEQAWMQHGKLHRENAPAIIGPNGRQEWWLNNRVITTEVENWIAQLNLPPWQEWGDVEKTLFRVSFR